MAMDFSIAGLSVYMSVLICAIILGVVHVSLQAYSFAGVRGVKWALGKRDDGKDLSVNAARFERASNNFRETFPFMAALLLVLELSQRGDNLAAYGAIIWLVARIIYLPAYVLGSALRPFAWGIAFFGLIMCFISIIN